MLRWQLQRGIVSLSKSAKPERVCQNFDIFDFELSDDDMAQIKTLNTNTTVFADHHEAATVELLAGLSENRFKIEENCYGRSSTKIIRENLSSNSDRKFTTSG